MSKLLILTTLLLSLAFYSQTTIAQDQGPSSDIVTVANESESTHAKSEKRSLERPL